MLTCLQGRRDGSSTDEAFAWPAREFLRKKYIGQPCTFRVDYTLEAVPGREFGSIFCGSDNLARSVVAAGWAKVGPAGPPTACCSSSFYMLSCSTWFG